VISRSLAIARAVVQPDRITDIEIEVP